MKYWSIACRLELIQKGDDHDKLNTQFSIINGLGIFFNVFAALGVAFIGNSENAKMYKII